MEKIFEKIEFVARQKGLSIGEVAEKAGISRQTLYSVKKTNNITVGTLEMVANALNVSVSIILDGKTSDPVKNESSLVAMLKQENEDLKRDKAFLQSIISQNMQLGKRSSMAQAA